MILHRIINVVIYPTCSIMYTCAQYLCINVSVDGSLSPDLYCRFKDERAKLTAQTQEMVSCLVTANFTLEQLATIFKNKEQFMSLVRTLKLWRSEVPNEDKLEEILQLRSRQCNALRQRCDEIKHLVLRCNQASCYSRWSLIG